MLLLLLATIANAGVFVDTGELELDTASTAAATEAKAALDAGRFEDAATLFGAIADAGGSAKARLAEAVAWYEAGFVRAARTAAEKAVAKDPNNVDAQVILGLSLVDGGAVEAGIARLQGARQLAKANGQTGAEARALTNIGLAQLDRGEKDEATRTLQAAQALANTAGDSRTLRAIGDGLRAASSLGGVEEGVGSKLGRGETGAARVEAQNRKDHATSRRDRIEADIDLAAVDRAEGRLDTAQRRLDGAVREAREAGLSREVAVGLANLGLVHSLAGRMSLAADTLSGAAKTASDGGYKVIEVDARCELGLVYVHENNPGAAAEQQRTAGKLLAGMSYAQGMARQAELGGAVASANGDTATANEALASAVSYYTSTNRPMDAARAATSLAAAWQGVDNGKAESWAKKATDYFAKAGEPLGPAHVALARALSDARHKDLDAALSGFATAADLAKKAGERGASLASIAQQDAAEAMVALGHDRDLAQLAAQNGLTDIVARAEKMDVGGKAYDFGLTAYQAGQYDVARQRFMEARQAFEALGEAAYATRARRAAAWAVYNQLVALPAAKSAPSWLQLVEEAAKVDDPELFARAYGASAVAAAKTGQKDLGKRFDECVRLANAQGLLDVSSRCHAAAAEAEGTLDARAVHARAAWTMAPADPNAVYALYAVAVDAYNGGRNDLALELGKLALPTAGALRDSVQQVIDAASTTSE